jgi:sulfatase maturation enzyme AslB (radical SAM superfamily)
MGFPLVCDKNNFNSADLYLAGSCNLKCGYCYISKNPGFYALDKEIQQCISEGVYLDNLKDVFTNRESLKSLSLWGGEPSLGFKSFSNSVIETLDEFPNLTELMTSTNFATDIKYLIDFLTLLNSHGRKIIFTLQISLDGPPHINDENRGKGVANIIKANLIRFYNYYNENTLENIKLDISFKATLSIENLEQLTDYQKLYDYYYFFEDIANKFYETNKNASITMYQEVLTITLVYPGQYTKQDGIRLYEFLKIAEDLHLQNNEKGLFKRVRVINFLKKRMLEYFEYFKKDAGVSYCQVYKTRAAIMSTRHSYICGCHRGYADFFEDYANQLSENNDLKDRNVVLSSRALRKAIKDNYFFEINDKALEYMNDKMSKVYAGQKSSILTIAALIREAAIAGQVSEIYLKDQRMLLAASFLIRCDYPCLYDNLATTGSFMLKDYSRIRLYCNGAFEFLLKDEEWEVSNK